MKNYKPIYYSAHEMRSYKNMILHGVYLSVYAIVKYLPFPFFNYLRFAVIKSFGININCTYISDGVSIMFPWRVSIGSGSSINQGVLIDGTGGIEIGRCVSIASYVTLNTADHDFSKKDVFIKEQGYWISPIIIGDDVWIGSNVQILKGVEIGKGSIIGAGSVVTKNIPSYTVAVGNPCRPIKTRD